MTALGSGKIWMLIPDWSRLKSSEPKAGDVTRKIGPLYFNILILIYFFKYDTIETHARAFLTLNIFSYR